MQQTNILVHTGLLCDTSKEDFAVPPMQFANLQRYDLDKEGAPEHINALQEATKREVEEEEKKKMKEEASDSSAQLAGSPGTSTAPAIDTAPQQTELEGPARLADIRVNFRENEELAFHALTKYWPSVPGRDSTGEEAAVDCMAIMARAAWAKVKPNSRPLPRDEDEALSRYI